ncbi:MAG: DUF2971 domain-containing protein [Defluviitaleaceae bacterium]|nr:DUF2971 domain-containing protein [Defluviitaleaceae bacterium]
MLGDIKMAILHPEYQIPFNGVFNSLTNHISKFQGGLPNTLYHYTPSFDAINGIVHNREIWLTNIAYLSDVAELDYIKSLMNEPELDPAVKEYLNNWKPISADFGTQIYVMSFSAKPDYLPLWATFTKMKGYSIGFNAYKLQNEILSKERLNIEPKRNITTSLETIVDLTKKYQPHAKFQGSFGGNWYLAPIIYDRQEQVRILNTLIKQTLEQFEEVAKTADKGLGQNISIIGGVEHGRIAKDNRAFDAAVNKLFDQCAVLFKSDDFAYEHEWCLIKHMDSNNPNLLRCQFFAREVDNTLIPYIKMALRNNLSFPINEIITAPLSILDTATSGLDFALYNAGYGIGENGVKVSKSKVKLRRF